MPLPALAAATPAAIELVKLLVTADGNRRAVEIARLETQVSLARIDLEGEKVSATREISLARINYLNNVLEAARSSFDKKAELTEKIIEYALCDIRSERESLLASRSQFENVITDPGASKADKTAARREITNIRGRLSELDTHSSFLTLELTSAVNRIYPAKYSA